VELLLPLLAVLAFALIWLAITYNAFVRLRNHCMESWAAIDTELRRRHDLIPNLVETVKGYATFERDLLERVTQARTAAHDSHGTAASQARVERELVGGLRQLIAVAENYPELKAHRHYLELQTELSNTEDRLQRARRFYNANVRDHNTRTEVFPSSVVASMFDVKRWEYFEVEEAVVRSNPRVELA
jgi:LemA protein